MGQAIINGWNAYRDIRDQTIEATFHALYDNPYMRALVGLDAPNQQEKVVQSDESALHAELRELRSELAAMQIEQGGPLEAFARVLIYMAGERTFIDERAFNMLQNLAQHKRQQVRLPSLEELRPIMRRQWRIVRAYPEQAINALPILVKDQAMRQSIWAAVSKIAELRDVLNVDEGVHQRFAHVARVMGLTSHWSPGVRESRICPEAVELPTPPKKVAAAHGTQQTVAQVAKKASKKASKRAATKKSAAKKTSTTK